MAGTISLIPQVYFGTSAVLMPYGSYDTWKLVPTSSVKIALPTQKVQTVEVPGRNGVIDLSNSLKIGGGPLFNNREGKFSFAMPTMDILNIHNWQQYINRKYAIYDSIVSVLHGRFMFVKTDRDSGTYYGRFEVGSLEDDGSSAAKLTISYSLEPEGV